MLKVSEIVKATGGKLVQGKLTASVKAVSSDTRKVSKGDLFVAIKGERYDGHNFLQQAVDAGACVLLVNRFTTLVPSLPAGKAGVAVVQVEDTLKALGALAAFYRRKFKVPVVAITGSAGKTTTKGFIVSVLGTMMKVHFNPGTENNQIGVPMAILRMTKAYKVIVLELGTNSFGEIDYLAGIVQPTVAVFTNIGASHLAGLGSPEGVLKEKRALVDHLAANGTIILNADDPLLMKIKKVQPRQKVLTYGVDAKADVNAVQVVSSKGGLSVTISKKDGFHLPTPVWGNVQNALAAVVCGKVLKVPFARIRKGLEKAASAKGRQCFHLHGGVTVIDDTYNANPVSYKNALRTLSLLPHKGRIFVVAADMLELGERCEALHEDVGVFASQSGVDHLWSVGRWAGLIGQRAKVLKPGIDVRHFARKEEIIPALVQLMRPGDIVLVKGSRGMRMEQVVEGILELLGREQ